MKMRTFELEHFLSAHEHKARHVLGTSGLATLPADKWPGKPPRLDLDYGPVPADEHLVHAIAEARGVPEENVLVTVGGTEALFLVPFALVEPGDRVLVESPTYFPVHGVPAALGARVEEFPRTLENDWRLPVDDIIQALDDDVSLVSLTNPNNPTGRLTPSDDLVRLADACQEVDAWLLVDDIFKNLAQPTPPVSHTLHPRIITAESLTKCYGLSGLRVGWLIAVPEVRALLREAKALTSIVNPSITQPLALEALKHEQRLLQRGLQITHANLTRWRGFAQRHHELEWREPDCPLLTAVRLPEGIDDVKFCTTLLDEEGVLLVPGSYVGLPGHFRLGFGGEPADFAAGLEGLGRHLARFA